jgi:Signal peptidase, peptidase S26
MTEQPTAAPTLAHHSRRDTTTISEYLESLLVTVILALFGTSFVVQAFKIPSPSMEKTLLVGDHLLVNKFVFGGTGSWYEKFQIPVRGSSAFCETRHWTSRRSSKACGPTGVHQRQAIE